MSLATSSPAAIPSPPQAEGEARFAVRSVPFATYELWVDSLPERSAVRMAYDGQDLEIRTKGVRHEDFRQLLGQMISQLCIELEIAHKGLGETTWKRIAIARGIEADQSYYFAPEKLAAAAVAKAKGSQAIADYPNPDMVIEVDISQPLVDRPGIYAALRVPELWRFNGEVLTIEALNQQGEYVAVDVSRWLPIRPEQITPWLVQEDTSDETAWARRLRRWIRTELTEAREIP